MSLFGIYGISEINHNNPGNIKLTSTPWKGKIKNNSNGVFEEFESLDYGYRACMLNLISYLKKGYNTINKIIDRWAPSSENSASSRANYKTYISNGTGLGINQKILAFDKELMQNFVVSMTCFEHNLTPNPSWALPIDNAWNMVVSYLGDTSPYLALNSVTQVTENGNYPNPIKDDSFSIKNIKIGKKTVFIVGGIGLLAFGGYILYKNYNKNGGFKKKLANA